MFYIFWLFRRCRECLAGKPKTHKATELSVSQRNNRRCPKCGYTITPDTVESPKSGAARQRCPECWAPLELKKGRGPRRRISRWRVSLLAFLPAPRWATPPGRR